MQKKAAILPLQFKMLLLGALAFLLILGILSFFVYSMLMTPLLRLEQQATIAQAQALHPLFRQERNLILYYTYLLFLGLTALVIGGQYYFMQRIVIRPLLHLGRSIHGISDIGSLAQRISPTGAQEFVALAQAINQMLTRLDFLQQRAQQYRIIVERSSAAIVLVHSVTRRLIDANTAFQQLSGYTQAEAQSLTIYDLLALPRHEIDHWLAAMLEKPQEQGRDLLYRHKDGELIAAEVTIIYLEGGENALYGVVARDMRARQQIQQALVKTIPDNYVRMRADGTYVEVHLSGELPWPYTADELIGHNLREFMPLETATLILEATQRALRTQQIESFHYERVLNGQCYYLDTRLLASGKDEIVAIIRNVTQQRQREEIIRYQASLVDSVSDAIIATDLDMQIISWNQAAVKTYGYAFEEVRGKCFRDVVRYEYVNGKHGQITEALQQKGVWQGEQRHHHRDGGSIYMWVSLSYMYDQQGKPHSVVGVNHNITERKSAERLLLLAQQSESLRVMAGGIAHDFNNLLTSMLAQNTLALRKLPADTKAATHISRAIRATERAAELTRQLLAYTGQGAFLLEMVNLNQLIQDNIGLLETIIPKHTQFQPRLAPLLSTVHIDRGHLQQAMMNLILNAVEAVYTATGLIQLTTGEQWIGQEEAARLIGAEQLTPGMHVFLAVRDNGTGMKAATIERIFDPYFTTKENGSGLGLAATLGIVKRYRGGLMVESQEGIGTNITLFFPVAEPSANYADQKAQSPTSNHGLVLVIDDEASIREVLGDLLPEEGYEVLLAHDGYDGLDKFKKHQRPIDLILLDMKMPGMNGAQTLAAIRALDRTIPVILCSGYSESEAMNALEGLSLTAFLPKPFDIPRLLTILKDTLMNSPCRVTSQGHPP